MTRDRLMEKLSYDARTGEFTWRHPRRVAGFLSCGGRYISICIDGVTYRRSRLAWLYYKGAFPVAELDHINGHKHDDRIANPKEVDRLENCWHYERHRSGYLPGTSYLKGPGLVKRWWARIKRNGKSRSLGYWLTQRDAHQAYVRELKRLGLPCPTLK